MGLWILLVFPILLAGRVQAQAMPEDARALARMETRLSDSLPEEKPPLATTFAELRLLIGRGDKITIATSGQRQTTGRVQSLTADALVVKDNDGQRTFSQSDVITIRQRRGDSLVNGAIIGLVVGVALCTPLFMFAEDFNHATYVVTPLVYGGLGAAAGAGIDGAIARQRTIYETSGARTTGLTSPSESKTLAIRLAFGF